MRRYIKMTAKVVKPKVRKVRSNRASSLVGSWTAFVAKSVPQRMR